MSAPFGPQPDHNQERPPTGPHLSVVKPGQERKRPGLGGLWQADNLMSAQFPDPVWAVDRILPEGLAILAGAPKLGKSWMSLGIALAIASGGRALGNIPVRQGPALYLALEDTPRRLQSRMTRLLSGQPAPAALTIATSCPPLRAGGAEAIADWIKANRGARLVVIDVFAKVKGANVPGISPYEADYAAMAPAKQIADRYGLAVLLVHHVRKAGSEDVFDQVSGTNGIAGSADTTLVLKRGRGGADGVLHITGRDVEEDDHAMTFDGGAWRMLDGPAADYTLSDTRSAILRYLREQLDPQPPKVIAEAIGIKSESVRQTCRRMAEDGQLTSWATGKYSAPGVTAVTGVTELPFTSDEGADLE